MEKLDPSKGERPLILLIENDEADVFLFRRALGKIDYWGDVRVVGSVSEARAYMENADAYEDTSYYRTPQLIVSDFRLNGPTALEFVRWLRKSRFADIPIVILSGAVRVSEIPLLSDVGIRQLVQKTADVMELASRLEPFLPVLWMTLLTADLISRAA